MANTTKWKQIPIGTRVRLKRGAQEGETGTVRSHINAGFRGQEHGVQGDNGPIFATWSAEDLEVLD